MAIGSDIVNTEIQDVYRKEVNVRTVAEDSLRLADFVPSRQNVVVEPIPPDAQTKGGLHIPEQARADKSVGWVVAVHPEDYEHRIGDLVYYRYGAGQQLRIEGRDVIVLQYTDRISDIMGCWPKEKLEAKSS